MEQIASRTDEPGGPVDAVAVTRPSICVVLRGGGAPSFANQTIQDYQCLANADEQEALDLSSADYFLWMTGDQPLRPHALEECIWALQAAEWVTWSDTGKAPPPSLEDFAGPLGVARATLEESEAGRTGQVRALPWRCRLEEPAPRADPLAALPPAHPRAPLISDLPAGLEVQPSWGSEHAEASAPRLGSGTLTGRVLKHLENAELLDARSWKEHPLRSLARLVPLRWKERVNDWSGRRLFDLSFYLKFEPMSVLIDGRLCKHIPYRTPAPAPGRRRIALFTPNLGFGGAENVLLDFARQIDRSKFEIFLIATHADRAHLRQQWERATDHVYDLGRMLPIEQAVAAIYSMALNWRWDVLVVQNTLAAYSVLPALTEKMPGLRVADILHNISDDWDVFLATTDVAHCIDRRVVISEAGREKLADLDYPEEHIRLIRNGVDLNRFDPARHRGDQVRGRLRLPGDTKILLFAGLLVPRKRPWLLARIDQFLQEEGSIADYHFVVAGDGPEAESLRARINREGRQSRFSLLGHVPDIAPLLAAASLLLVTSDEEGVPLVINEALAMQVAVVSTRVGAVDEALPPECGVLVDHDDLEAAEFASAIRDLLADDARRQEMGRAGRRFVEREFASANTHRQYRELIAELDG